MSRASWVAKDASPEPLSSAFAQRTYALSISYGCPWESAGSPFREPLTRRTRRSASRTQSASVRRMAAGSVMPTGESARVQVVDHRQRRRDVLDRSRADHQRHSAAGRVVARDRRAGPPPPPDPRRGAARAPRRTRSPRSPAPVPTAETASTSVRYSSVTSAASASVVTAGAARSRLTQNPRSARSAATASADSTVSPPTTRLTTSRAIGRAADEPAQRLVAGDGGQRAPDHDVPRRRVGSSSAWTAGPTSATTSSSVAEASGSSRSR